MAGLDQVLSAATPVTSALDQAVSTVAPNASPESLTPELAGDIVGAHDDLHDVRQARQNPLWYRMLTHGLQGAVVGGLGFGAKGGAILAGEKSLVPGMIGGAGLGAAIGGGGAIASELLNRATEGSRLRRANRLLGKIGPTIKKRLEDPDVQEQARSYQSSREYPLRLTELGLLAGGVAGAAAGIHRPQPVDNDTPMQVFGVDGPLKSKMLGSAKGSLIGGIAGGALGLLGGILWRRHQRQKLTNQLRKTADLPENVWLETNAPRTTPTGGNPRKASNRSTLIGMGGRPESYAAGRIISNYVKSALANLTSDTSTSPAPDQIRRPDGGIDYTKALRRLAARRTETPEQAAELLDSWGVEKLAEGSANLRSRSETIAYNADGVVAIRKSDFLQFPGGGIDDGEDAEAAAYREAIEEADLKLLHLHSIGVQEVVWPKGEKIVEGFDGFRNYLFVAMDGGKLGTTHDDNEDFVTIPFKEAIDFLTELRTRKELEWRIPMIDAELEALKRAKDLAEDGELTPIKLARLVCGQTKKHVDKMPFGLQIVDWHKQPNADGITVTTTDPEAMQRSRDRAKVAEQLNDEELEAYCEAFEKLAAAIEAQGPRNVVMEHHEADREGNHPAILIDMDDTVRQWKPGPNMYAGLNSHHIMPGRKETLQPLKAMGFKVIGVTNHCCKDDAGHKGLDPERLHKIQHETIGMMDGALDDIVFTHYPDPDVLKPAPTMLHYAMKRHGLDPNRTIMVGDNEDHDGGAAKAAGVPYMHPDHFFADPEVTVAAIKQALSAHEQGQEKKADVINTMPVPEYINLNSQGQVLAAPDKNRRYRFPRVGTGKPAPYEPTLRFLPPEGATEPGVHGYDVNFHVGQGDMDPTTAGMEGAQWMDPQAVLKDMYASMGLKANSGYRDLDRARARVLLRALKKRQPTAAPVAPVHTIQPPADPSMTAGPDFAT